jgi:UDP-3-O-[3-hydroxymyristoyl] glucosamine N-acyltransferase
MSMKISNLLTNDALLELVSPSHADLIIGQVSLPTDPVDGTLCFLKDQKLLAKFEAKLSSAIKPVVVLPKKLWSSLDESAQKLWFEKTQAIMTSENPALSIAHASKLFYHAKMENFQDLVDGRQLGETSIHPSVEISQGAFISSHVEIAQNVVIHSGVRIMNNVKIDEGSVLYPNVVVYPFTRIGKNCRLHANAVIGSDGFGYVFDGKDHVKIWHMGGVDLGDDVEVGSNTSIDQGTFTPTRIGPGCRLDNMVQIGHNCRLGRGVVICGHVAIGGSSTLGDYVVFGGKSGMGDHMELGPGCQVAGGALVNMDWPAKTVLGGHPARPLKEWMRGLAMVRKLSLRKGEDLK